MRGRKACLVPVGVLFVLSGPPVTANTAVPAPVCNFGGVAHYLCGVSVGSGTTFVVDPFATTGAGALSGDLGNQAAGTTYIFIEGPYTATTNVNDHKLRPVSSPAVPGYYDTTKVDWLKGTSATGTQYSRVTNGGNTLFPTGLTLAARHAAGTSLYSYYIRSRAPTGVGAGQPAEVWTGSLTFHYPIVAVIATNGYDSADKLTASNPLFGARNAAGTLLSNYGAGDHSLDATANDWIKVSSDFKTLYFSFSLRTPDSQRFDALRIVTLTPEPAAFVLFGTTAAVLLGAARLRKRRRVNLR